jgi:predicted methyltransferase
MKRFQALLCSTVLIAVSCAAAQAQTSSAAPAAKDKLTEVLDARSDQLKARDSSRHPRETIDFFGLVPGMKIAEVLPGGGWYTQVLAPYIGTQGAIYGINYDDNLWAMFGFFSKEQIAKQIASTNDFANQVAKYAGAGMTAQGFTFGKAPPALNGSLDAVVLVRALHNLNRFEQAAGTRTTALKSIHALLKPGGIVGVVQHRAPADADDGWADGSKGYLKQAAVVAMFKQQGFELIASSEINANPADKPGVEDVVWRLPPSLNTTPDNKAAMAAIGESDRMTLKFRKK